MSEQIIAKTCRICKQTKNISEFNKDSKMRGGHVNICKICQREQQAQNRKRYQQTENFKTAQRKYCQGEKGKEKRKHYRQSERGKAVHKHYEQSEEGKLARKRYHKSEKGKAKLLRAAKQQRIRHPDRVKAREVVNNAIRVGQLPRLDTLQCSCGETAKHYHHHKGYAPEHWLDVIPVCFGCHKH